MKKLLEIFTMFFKIGMFTIGGGYAMLPIIQKEVVDKKSWMNEEEFLDAISLTNSLPGPLATWVRCVHPPTRWHIVRAVSWADI